MLTTQHLGKPVWWLVANSENNFIGINMGILVEIRTFDTILETHRQYLVESNGYETVLMDGTPTYTNVSDVLQATKNYYETIMGKKYPTPF